MHLYKGKEDSADNISCRVYLECSQGTPGDHGIAGHRRNLRQVSFLALCTK